MFIGEAHYCHSAFAFNGIMEVLLFLTVCCRCYVFMQEDCHHCGWTVVTAVNSEFYHSIAMYGVFLVRGLSLTITMLCATVVSIEDSSGSAAAVAFQGFVWLLLFLMESPTERTFNLVPDSRYCAASCRLLYAWLIVCVMSSSLWWSARVTLYTTTGVWGKSTITMPCVHCYSWSLFMRGLSTVFLIRDIVLLSCGFLSLLYVSLIWVSLSSLWWSARVTLYTTTGVWGEVDHYNVMCPLLFLMESLHERTFNCVPDSRYCAAFMRVFVCLTYCTCH